jgi:hypothetical protein
MPVETFYPGISTPSRIILGERAGTKFPARTEEKNKIAPSNFIKWALVQCGEIAR